MKKAWIVNNIVRDVCGGNPTEMFHRDVAVMYDTDVPDDVVAGAEIVNGVWVNPAITPEAESPAAAEPVMLTKLQFRRLFTLPELIKFDNCLESADYDAETKAILRTIKTNLDLADYISLQDPLTIDGIRYAAAVGIIGAGRADEILGSR